MEKLRMCFSVVFILLFIEILSDAAPATHKVSHGKAKMPVAIKNPMLVESKENAAKIEKTNENERSILLGFICFMEFGANNEVFRALNAGDKNKDGKLTIEEFYSYYSSNEELASIVFHTKENMFTLFDRNKDGVLSAQDTLTSTACDRAKEEKSFILPSYMEETFNHNLDATMFIKNEGIFDELMEPIRKYILFMYDSLRLGKVTENVVNYAVWGACRDIKHGGVVSCEVLQLDRPNQMIVIRNWIKMMIAWSKKHPMR